MNLFLIEYSGPLVLWLLFFVFNLNHWNSYYLVCTLLVAIHYIKRLYESKFVHIFSNDTAPLIPSFKNFSFYWIVFGILVPLEIFVWRSSYFDKQHLPDGIVSYFLIFLFLIFELGNYHCHVQLRKLRLNVDGTISKERKIPKGLFFDNIISPNYSFEILSWVTFVIISQSFFSFIFILGGGIQMFIWGKQKKSKLLQLDITEEKKKEIKKKYIIFPSLI